MQARLIAALSRPPEARDYLFAAGLAGVAVMVRAALELAAPGVGSFVVLLPAVVLASVFCGTAPGVVAASTGGIAIAALFLRSPLLAWPPFNATQLDALLFLPACATVLWAAQALRRTVADVVKAEARLAEVFRQVPGAVALLEAPDGKLLLRSTQSDAVLGHTQKRMEQTGDLAAYGGLHADGRPYAAYDYPIVRALKTGEIVQGERIRYRRPDGQVADLEVHAGPVRDPRGTIVAAVGMAFDVSDRVAAERRLLESEAQQRAVATHLRAALDAGGLGLWEFDLATRRMRLDAIFAEMLELPSGPISLTEAELADLVDPVDLNRVRSVFAGAIADGSAYADEFRMRTTQGATRWLASRGALVADMQKIVGVVRDVTERRQREAALQSALEAREVLMREADHRIKNSLQLVGSLLRLQRGKVVHPDARHALGEAIARVSAVGNAHLALQGGSDLRTIEIDRLLLDMSQNVGALNPSVTIRCHANAGLQVDADQAIPLGLIVSETLINALRHAYSPGVHGEVVLSATAAHGVLDVAINDDGIGMSPTDVPQGLGSTVIATLARQIGATVTTESRPGLGTRVAVRLNLPAAPRAPDASVSAPSEPWPAAHPDALSV